MEKNKMKEFLEETNFKKCPYCGKLIKGKHRLSILSHINRNHSKEELIECKIAMGYLKEVKNDDGIISYKRIVSKEHKRKMSLWHTGKVLSEEHKRRISLSSNSQLSFETWQNKGLKSKGFKGFKCYVIECWNDSERFYKVGSTFISLKMRLTKFKMPYNFKIIKVFEGSAEFAFNKEKEIKTLTKDCKYVPKIRFSGFRECFSSLKGIDF